MPKSSKHGTAWQDEELDAIVADYFEMLVQELSDLPYVKLRHSTVLMAQIGRTHRSVEFKHQNISAVLDELGLPWIRGYTPKPNYQNAIFDAVDRYLSKNPSIFEFVPISMNRLSDFTITSLFVEAPTASAPERATPARMRRLVSKFDPAERDLRNRSLGKAGEEFVFNVEKGRLAEVGRKDLAYRVRWVSVEDGDGAGYDVLSFDLQGRERRIEVKTTNGGARTPFFLTRNEFAMANNHPEHWKIYRVHMFATDPHIFTISPPLQRTLLLEPVSWRASVGPAVASLAE